MIDYVLDSCNHCLKCVKVCPTEAIRIVDNKVVIDDHKCIYCDKCIHTCHKGGLKVDNSHMSLTFDDYDYKVALIPTSVFSDFQSEEEAKVMFKAIEKLGFDEIVDYSDVEGALYLKTIEYTEKESKLKLTSFCPCINHLIKQQYPMLYEDLIPFDYPVEVAAKRVRERLKDKGKVGIYSLCDCVAKKTLAKYPFANPNSQIDHAMSLSHIFPKALKLKNDETTSFHLCQEGIQSVVSDFYHYGQGTRSLVSVSGVDHCIQALELAEFGHLDDIGLLALFACQGGCIGGRYLWSNPFLGRLHIDTMSCYAQTEVASLKEEWYLKEHQLDEEENMSMKEKMRLYNKINEILENLPRYDCGACGYPNCKALALDIFYQKASIHDCRVKKEGNL